MSRAALDLVRAENDHLRGLVRAARNEIADTMIQDAMLRYIVSRIIRAHWDVEHDRAVLAGLLEGWIATRELHRVTWRAEVLGLAVGICAVVSFVRRARRGEDPLVTAALAPAVERTVAKVPRVPGWARRRAMELLYLRARPEDVGALAALPLYISRAGARASLGALYMRGYP